MSVKTVIVEDEPAAVTHLKSLLAGSDLKVDVIAEIDTVADAISYFDTSPGVDLIFMDIRLADGISFEIFEEVDIHVPLIFTTAYDEYALRAFEVNSIDYLLKPIQETDLRKALTKFQRFNAKDIQVGAMLNTLQELRRAPKRHRQSFLVQQRESLIPVSVADFAYFCIRDGLVKGKTFSGKTHHIEEKLEDLEIQLDPEHFFRANRQYILQRTAIQAVSPHFNGRLLVRVQPKPSEEILVSKVKARVFKRWLGY